MQCRASASVLATTLPQDISISTADLPYALNMQEAQRSWTFNMFELDEATDHHALSCYAYFCWQVSI